MHHTSCDPSQHAGLHVLQMSYVKLSELVKGRSTEGEASSDFPPPALQGHSAFAECGQFWRPLGQQYRSN